jgi:hypothetical protein
MRSRPAGGRPTWWVVLAVSLALMALIAATAARTGGTSNGPRLPKPSGARASTTTSRPAAASSSHSSTVPSVSSTSPSSPLVATGSTTAPATRTPNAITTSPPTTAAAVSNTTTPPGVTNQGYLQPSLNNSSATYSFTGQGPSRVSVTWSGSTYLTLQVTCTGFNQSTGGSSAMALSIPNAQGQCQATLSEPTTENTTVSYTLSVTPTGG